MCFQNRFFCSSPLACCWRLDGRSATAGSMAVVVIVVSRVPMAGTAGADGVDVGNPDGVFKVSVGMKAVLSAGWTAGGHGIGDGVYGRRHEGRSSGVCGKGKRQE